MLPFFNCTPVGRASDYDGTNKAINFTLFFFGGGGGEERASCLFLGPPGVQLVFFFFSRFSVMLFGSQGSQVAGQLIVCASPRGHAKTPLRSHISENPST